MSSSDTPRTADDPLRLSRALAIEEYANVESALCMVLSGLLGVEPAVAAIIFFKITAADVRNSIIQTLIERVHGDAFTAFWNGSSGAKKTPKLSGLWKLVRQLDKERNFIVHWHPTFYISGTSHHSRAFTDYRPPFYWARMKEYEPLNRADFESFISRAEFAAASLEMFYLLTGGDRDDPVTDAARQAWLPVFQEAATYPPAATHPFSKRNIDAEP